MSQPRWTADQLSQMTNEQIVTELRAWAAVREELGPRRLQRGKELLDTLLLREAAARLEH